MLFLLSSVVPDRRDIGGAKSDLRRRSSMQILHREELSGGKQRVPKRVEQCCLSALMVATRKT